MNTSKEKLDARAWLVRRCTFRCNEAQEKINTFISRLQFAPLEAAHTLAWSGDGMVEAAANLELFNGLRVWVELNTNLTLEQLRDLLLQRMMSKSRNVESSSGTMHNVCDRHALAAIANAVEMIDFAIEVDKEQS